MSEIDLYLFSKIKTISFYDILCINADLFINISFWKDRQNFLLMEDLLFFLNEHENIFSITFFCVIFIFSSVYFTLIYLIPGKLKG